MNIKKIWTLLLLLAMSFSIVHAYAFSAIEADHHGSVHEYIQELSVPTDHGDICDIHFEYHVSYLLPEYFILPDHTSLTDTLFNVNERIEIDKTTSLFRPPIFS